MTQIDNTLDDKIQRGLLAFLRISLIGGLFWFASQFDLEAFLLTSLALWLTRLPDWLERRFKVQFPIEFTLIIVAFMYFTIFLGNVNGAYERYFWWDAALHALSGIILGFVGFLALVAFLSVDQIKQRPKLFAFFAFMFALAAGSIWEIFEFVMDELFDTGMQISLSDTMWDLIVDALGALFVSALAYSYGKNEGINFVSRGIQSFLKRNPQIKQ